MDCTASLQNKKVQKQVYGIIRVNLLSRTSNNLTYFAGTLSQDSRRRETAPWPRPLSIANMELKFFTTLQYPINKQSQTTLAHFSITSKTNATYCPA